MLRLVVAAALSSAFAIGLAMGCNTAQINEPPVEDGGSGFCNTTSPTQRACDAGAFTVGCAPQADAAATSGLPQGLYPLGCTVSTSIFNGQGDCQIVHQCTCVAAEASGATGGGDAGDAGASTSGSTGAQWTCLE
jgi:hypothetical protein